MASFRCYDNADVIATLMMTNFHLYLMSNTTVGANFPNVCLWQRIVYAQTWEVYIDNEKLCWGTFVCQYGLCCCIVWPLFPFDCFVKIWVTCKNFLGKWFTAPPWPKIACTPMATLLHCLRHFLNQSITRRTTCACCDIVEAALDWLAKASDSLEANCEPLSDRTVFLTPYSLRSILWPREIYSSNPQSWPTSTPTIFRKLHVASMFVAIGSYEMFDTHCNFGLSKYITWNLWPENWFWSCQLHFVNTIATFMNGWRDLLHSFSRTICLWP